jgi:uncharacterized membrane protein
MTSGARPRRGYIDWMRGLAVLIMIEAHVVDSWTAAPYRESTAFGWSIILGGFGAPLFLFLAGVAVALSASAKARRAGNDREASRSVMRRGLEIFLLAFLFRLQAVIVSWGSFRSMLKVDILNIMGPSIVAAAALWGALRTTRARYVGLATAAIATALLTPIVRITPIFAALPDPIEGYLRPIPGLTNFTLFPWAGFVFGGAVVGMLINDARSRSAETRVNVSLGIAGVALAVGGYGASFLPSPYAYSYFWTSSPTYFFLRLGLMIAALALAYAWEARRSEPGWSAMQQLGRTSLFIYWIHVEMVYGLISLPLHKSLSLAGSWIAFALFAVSMLGVSLLKDRIVRWWQSRRVVAPALVGQG